MISIKYINTKYFEIEKQKNTTMVSKLKLKFRTSTYIKLILSNTSLDSSQQIDRLIEHIIYKLKTIFNKISNYLAFLKLLVKGNTY